MNTNDATTPLLSTPQAVEQDVQTYASIESAETQRVDENGDIVKTVQVETTTTWRLWRSNSYIRSLGMLIILFIVFTGLELALLKLNLPAVSP